MTRRWYSSREAGEYFCKPPKTLLSLAARGRFPEGSVIKLGRELRFDVSAIERGLAMKGKQR